MSSLFNLFEEAAFKERERSPMWRGLGGKVLGNQICRYQ